MLLVRKPKKTWNQASCAGRKMNTGSLFLKPASFPFPFDSYYHDVKCLEVTFHTYSFLGRFPSPDLRQISVKHLSGQSREKGLERERGESEGVTKGLRPGWDAP